MVTTRKLRNVSGWYGDLLDESNDCLINMLHPAPYTANDAMKTAAVCELLNERIDSLGEDDACHVVCATDDLRRYSQFLIVRTWATTLYYNAKDADDQIKSEQQWEPPFGWIGFYR